jgi:hypothetical protein
VPGLRAWKHEHEETELTCYVIDHHKFCMYCMRITEEVRGDLACKQAGAADAGIYKKSSRHAATLIRWAELKASNYSDGECDVCIVNKPHVVRAVCCTAHKGPINCIGLIRTPVTTASTTVHGNK